MQRPSNIKDRILWLVVAVWLVGAAYATWFFELRFQRQFVSAARATLFESGSEAPAAEVWFRRRIAGAASRANSPGATVVHVYDANCPCNRFTEPHLARIETSYQRRRVRFVRVERSSPIGAVSPRWIEATPAALVFDAHAGARGLSG
jgi:Zn-dependent protease with chaperone function